MSLPVCTPAGLGFMAGGSPEWRCPVLALGHLCCTGHGHLEILVLPTRQTFLEGALGTCEQAAGLQGWLELSTVARGS